MFTSSFPGRSPSTHDNMCIPLHTLAHALLTSHTHPYLQPPPPPPPPPAQKMSFSWPKLNWYTSIPGDDDDYTVDPEQALADSMMEHAKIEVIYPANMTSDSSKGCGHTCQRSSRRRRK